MDYRSYIFLICLIFGVNPVWSQVRPDRFPVDNSPSPTDAFYTQEGLRPRKIFLSVLDTFFAADVYELTYVGDTSTVDPDRGDLAINGTSDTLLIYAGSAWVVFSGGGGGATIDSSFITNDSIFLATSAGDFFTGWDDLPFDGNRQIERVPSVGTNMETTTVLDWIEWWYTEPFVFPSISISQSPSTTIFEVGTSTSITYSGSVSNPSGATMSNGFLLRTSPSIDTLDSFGSGTSYSANITFEPQKDSTAHYKRLSYSFRAQQDWSDPDEGSGTRYSSTRTITAIYPVLYGMSATDLSASGDPYTELTKLLQSEGNKTVSLNGSGFIYYLIPKTWSDFNLSAIYDHNDFNVTASFDTYDVTVNSSGLTNNWSAVDYKMYKLRTVTTTSNYAYQFIR